MLASSLVSPLSTFLQTDMPHSTVIYGPLDLLIQAIFYEVEDANTYKHYFLFQPSFKIRISGKVP